MDFEDFEGFKRVENSKNLTVEQIVSLLDSYKEILGDIKYEFGLDSANICIDFEGRYSAEIRLNQDAKQIIIERKLDENAIEDADSVIEKGKDLSEVKADRLIEQIYDLLNDYMDDGIITEHITGVKEVVYMEEADSRILKINNIMGSGISVGNMFSVRNKNNKELYLAKESPITRSYVLENCETKRKEISINYSEFKNQKYSITIQPFENLVFEKDKDSIKTKFIAKTTSKEYKVSGDYTDNHYLIELNEVVIGAIDCLDPMIKTKYKIEVNDEKELDRIVSIAVILDTYSRKEESIKNKKNIIESVKKK